MNGAGPTRLRQCIGMKAWTGLVLGLLWVSPAFADTLAYIRASSQLNPKQPARFHPINLLDDDPQTVWCSAADATLGEGVEIQLFFKKPQRIDRVVVRATPATGRLVSSLRLSDESNNARLRLPQNPSSTLEERLTPPMRGKTFTVTIDRVGAPKPGSKVGAKVVCLADVMLYWRKRAFGGRTAPSEFRYNARRDRILGAWSGEPLGAPEKFLTFALDGTWVWRYEPLLGGRRQRLAGEYRFRGDRLLMRKGAAGRWSDMRFKLRRVRVDPNAIGAPSGAYDVISLNTSLGKKLGGSYNNAEF